MRKKVAIGFGIGLLAALSLTTIWRRPPDANFGNTQIQLERVSSPEKLQKGLSDRQSLPQDQGMLFIFNSAGKECFWMKDMNFPLDIIWLNSDKRVVTIKENVAPETYPESFCPDAPAQYVIEVNAGVAKKSNITIGSQLQF